MVCNVTDDDVNSAFSTDGDDSFLNYLDIDSFNIPPVTPDKNISGKKIYIHIYLSYVKINKCNAIFNLCFSRSDI